MLPSHSPVKSQNQNGFTAVTRDRNNNYVPTERFESVNPDRLSDAHSSPRGLSPVPPSMSPLMGNFGRQNLSPFPQRIGNFPTMFGAYDQQKDHFNEGNFEHGFRDASNQHLSQRRAELPLPQVPTHPSLFRQVPDARLSNQSFSQNGRNTRDFKVDSASNSDDGNESEETEPKDKKRLSKGLKQLSVTVRSIVIEKKKTTYKEVADIILKEAIRDEHLNTNKKTEIVKEEQNIKRRVYDALNVLISAGILIKEGKNVRKNEKVTGVNINFKRTEIQTLESKIVC